MCHGWHLIALTTVLLSGVTGYHKCLIIKTKGDKMNDYNKEHKHAQCLSALGMLEFAELNSCASTAIQELIVKSYGLQCSTKLSHPRQFMLSKKSVKPLIQTAVKESELRYGSDFKKQPSLVAKQAVYLLCGRDKSNKVTDDCKEWRNGAIGALLTPKIPKQLSKTA